MILSCASWIRIKSQDFIVSNYMWAIWILKLNIFQEHKSDKSHVLQRNCWVGQHVCWQHDIFVGSDVMAHKRFFYLPCYCKERSRISNCYGKEKALQGSGDEKREFSGEPGECAGGGQWDAGQSPTQVSTSSVLFLHQWKESICLNRKPKKHKTQ